MTNNILNEYFNLLENKEIQRLIMESEHRNEIQGFGKKIKTIVSNIKLSKQDETKSKNNIKENRKTPKYKKLEKIIKDFLNKKEKDKTRLRKELDSLYGYAVSNFLTIIISMWSVYSIYTKRNGYPLNKKAIIDLIFSLGELPGPIIVKIITRSKKSLNDLNTEMNEEVPITPGLEIFFSIVFVAGFFITIPACVNILMLIGLLIKIVWGIVLGVKLNSWGYLNKNKNVEV